MVFREMRLVRSIARPRLGARGTISYQICNAGGTLPVSTHRRHDVTSTSPAEEESLAQLRRDIIPRLRGREGERSSVGNYASFVRRDKVDSAKKADVSRENVLILRNRCSHLIQAFRTCIWEWLNIITLLRSIIENQLLSIFMTPLMRKLTFYLQYMFVRKNWMRKLTSIHRRFRF